MLAHIFPGQGSQKRGMGGTLFDEVVEYQRFERDVDRLLGYSLRTLCLQDRNDELKQTQFTQPALYVVNALHHYQAVAQGARPAFVAGHSLGEYNALLAAGAFDFMTGLQMVKKRGELMAAARNGLMAAVVGLEAGRIAELLREGGHADLDVANLNSSKQVVVSGPSESITRARPTFEKAGAALYLPLQVSGAFHSRYMSGAASAFAAFLEPLAFAEPTLPVVSNVSAEPYPRGVGSGPVKSLLVQQITRPVNWVGCVRYLLAAGVSSFKEMGPGTVLTRLVQQVQKESA